MGEEMTPSNWDHPWGTTVVRSTKVAAPSAHSGPRLSLAAQKGLAHAFKSVREADT